MSERYLEITFRRGRPFAAYLYLPRVGRERSAQSKPAAPGLVVDYTRRGKPIGIEITTPAAVTLTGLNRVLRALGQPALRRTDFAPLRTA